MVLSFVDSLTGLEIGNERTLLDQIDKLRACGIENYVKLPQIVVVGDQSAGKSSVLEALTGVQFPRSESRCTRFATEIRLRRSQENKYNISILPDASRSESEKRNLTSFGNVVRNETDFGVVMARAIESIYSGSNQNQFSSKDILRIEISGPTQSHLTIVDLPGFITTSNRYQTQEDVDSIAEIAHRYMQSSRTIILAIVSAAYDCAIQPVIQKARELDSTGIRTIGLITKPDKAEATRVDEFVALARNMDIKLRLGWHVLRNRSHNEANLSTAERNQIEKEFFSQDKWNTLPQDSIGIEALKPRLSRQLQRHIRENMPQVQEEIVKHLKECETELGKLGDGRDTIPAMRIWLIQLCQSSKVLTDLARDGQYKNPKGLSFFPRVINKEKTHPRKLRTRVNEVTEDFVQNMHTHGRAVDIVDDGESHIPDLLSRRKMSRAKYIEEEVAPLFRESTGEELPDDYNPLLVYNLFQGYSTDWSIYAEAFKLEIDKICEDFLAEVIQFIWPGYMRESLRTFLLDDLMKERIMRAEAEVRQLYIDRERYSRTFDQEYMKKMNEWRATVSSNPEQRYSTHEKLLQKMLIYYELTCKTFISNVIVQVIERHLLDGLGEVFDLAQLVAMDDANIEQIASEDEETRKRRLYLKDKKKVFGEGLRICRNIAMRRDLGPVSTKIP